MHAVVSSVVVIRATDSVVAAPVLAAAKFEQSEQCLQFAAQKVE